MIYGHIPDTSLESIMFLARHCGEKNRFSITIIKFPNRNGAKTLFYSDVGFRRFFYFVVSLFFFVTEVWVNDQLEIIT